MQKWNLSTHKSLLDILLFTFWGNLLISFSFTNSAFPLPALATPFTNAVDAPQPIPKLNIRVLLAFLPTNSIMFCEFHTSPSVIRNIYTWVPIICNSFFKYSVITSLKFIDKTFIEIQITTVPVVDNQVLMVACTQSRGHQRFQYHPCWPTCSSGEFLPSLETPRLTSDFLWNKTKRACVHIM